MGKIAAAMAAIAAQDSAKVRPGATNAALPCCGAPRHLQIGFFFDGTNNYNKFDQEQALKDQEWEQQQNGREVERQKRRENEHAAEQQAAQRERDWRATAAQLDKEQKTLEAGAAAHKERALSYERRLTPKLSMDAASRLQEQRADAWDAWRAANSKAGEKNVEAQKAEREAETARKEKERLAGERASFEEDAVQGSPGESGLSNVAKLHELYPDDPLNDIYNRYIRGVGAVTAATTQDDYSSVGSAFGLGPEGGQARILEAGEKLQTIIKKLLPCPPDSVTIDIFGFSRGAALARHFVNVILAGLPDYSKKIEPASGEVKPLGALRAVRTFVGSAYDVSEQLTGMYPALPNVKIRFVGLFDTVGSFYWPGNKDDGEFVTRLPAGCAGKVVHLVAAYERRKNFRYINIAGVGEEIILAGVHADIGGGYQLSEKIFLVMDKEVYVTFLSSSGKAKAETKILQRAQAHGICSDGVLAPGCFLKHVPVQTPNPSGSVNWICYLLRSKITDNRYATVPLHLMQQF